MTKGAYDINDANVGPTKDGSFRSMLCAMLVFMSICGIILIVAWPWRNSGGNGQSYVGNSPGYTDRQQQNYGHTDKPDDTKEETTKSFGKLNAIIQSTTTEQVPIKPPNVDNATAKIEKPSKPVIQTETSQTTPITVTTGSYNFYNKTDSVINNPKPSVNNKTTTVAPQTNQENVKDLDRDNHNTTTQPKTTSDLGTTSQIVDVGTTTVASKTNQGKDYKTTEQPEDSIITTPKTVSDLGTDIGSTTQFEDAETTTVASKTNQDLISDKDHSIKQTEDGTSTTPETVSDLGSTIQSEDVETTTVTSKTNQDLISDKGHPIKQPEDGTSTTPETVSDLGSTIQSEDVETTTVASKTNQDLISDKGHPIKQPEDGTSTTPETVSDLGSTIQSEDVETTTVASKTNQDLISDKGHPIKQPEDGTSTTPETVSDLGSTIQSEDVETTTVASKTNQDLISDKGHPIKQPEDGTSTTPETVSDLGSTIQSEDVETTTVASKTNQDLISDKGHPIKQPEDGTSTTLETVSDLGSTIQSEDVETTTVASKTNQDLISDKGHSIKQPEDGISTTPETVSDLGSTIQSEDVETTTVASKTNQDLISDKGHPIKQPEDGTSTTPETVSDLGSTTQPEEAKATTQKNDLTTLPSKKSTRLDMTESAGDDEYFAASESPKNTNHNLDDNDECKAECRKVGARILSRMDYSADPCEHFYDYACGGDNIDNAPEDNWKRIAGGLNQINAQSPDVYTTFQNFYERCVDFHTDYDYNQRIVQAKYILSTVGHPYKAVEGVDAKSALTDLLTRLLQLDSSPLFDISVDVDKESKHFIFQLNVGKRFSTLLNDNSVLATKRKCINISKKRFNTPLSHFNYLDLNEIYHEYSNCMQNETHNIGTLEKALNAFELYDALNSSVADVNTILQIFYKYKQQHSLGSSIRKDIITKKVDTLRVFDLELNYPHIEWQELLSNLVGQEIGKEDLVQVYFKGFFSTMFSNKQKLTIPQLYNAILAMYVHDLYTNFVLPTLMANPEEFCLHQSSDLMKEVASSLYLQSIHPEDIEGDLTRITKLFEKMTIKLKDMIGRAEGWSLSFRITLNKKLKNMVLDTWRPTLVWKDISLVQKRMENVSNNYENYVDFAAALVRRNRKVLYKMWDKMAYEQEYVWWHFITPYSTNPVSIYALNRIVIPPGMLFTNSKEIPRYLSLAKLGYSLAKAIGYHFDYTGSKYDIILDQNDQMAYNDMETCTSPTYVNKKLNVEYDGINITSTVNKNSFMLSANERFVEDMAINLLSEISNERGTDYQISWIDYNHHLSKAFSREKMFFIALGQEHCRKLTLEDYFLHLFESEHLPPSILLDTALSHSTVFKDAFTCSDGSRMDATMYECKAFPEFPPE